MSSLQDGGGTLDSAARRQGQVGGLLAVHDCMDTPGDAGDDVQDVHACDGNGNVVQVLDWAPTSASAVRKARYEYDPYGNSIFIPDFGAYNRQPFRSSTKYWDDETGLGYWGYRWYSPVLGRRISRDPIGENGGLNLQRFVSNQPTGSIDALGHAEACCYYDRRQFLFGPKRPDGATTVDCGQRHWTGTECCKCCSGGKKLTKATWRRCCFCDIQVQVMSVNLPGLGGVQIPGMHERIAVVCDNGEQVVAEMRGGVNCGKDDVLVSGGYPLSNPGWQVRMWGGPQSIRVDCACAAPLVSALKALQGKKQPYITGVHDCRHFARGWFDVAKSLPCYRDLSATEKDLLDTNIGLVQ